MGLDLLGYELSEHLHYIAIEFDGFLGIFEAVAFRVRKLVLRDPHDRVPVDALVEVVLKIVIVFEEIGHDYCSPSFFV